MMGLFAEVIDYKKELETAAKSMISVREPQLLIKMIARMLVQKVDVSHAGILLHIPEKDTYIFTVSRGIAGVKIPTGFARMDYDNPLIKFFRERYDKRILRNGALVYDRGKELLGSRKLNPEDIEILRSALYQMEIFDAIVCLPSYFGHELLGLVLLGRKNNGKEFSKEELDFFVALASDVSMAIRNAQLFQQLEAELDKKRRLFINTTLALAATIDAKDHYTSGHTSRVTALSLEIAKRLMHKHNAIVDMKFMENLHIASLLHDIGKIGIAESILNKNGPLDEEEKKIMQSHAVKGANILGKIKELDDAIVGVKYHHEKYDGSGYPEGLKGSEIPMIAAVIAVADAFDAMTTDRPYRKGLSKEEAAKEIETLKGKQFEPQATEALLELYREGGL